MSSLGSEGRGAGSSPAEPEPAPAFFSSRAILSSTIIAHRMGHTRCSSAPTAAAHASTGTAVPRSSGAAYEPTWLG